MGSLKRIRAVERTGQDGTGWWNVRAKKINQLGCAAAGGGTTKKQDFFISSERNKSLNPKEREREPGTSD